MTTLPRPTDRPRHARALVCALVGAAVGVLVWQDSPRAATFNNPDPFTIPVEGLASPYPSEITVTGLNGNVKTVTVTISNFSHTFTNDVGIALVAPGGQAMVLIDGVGQSGDSASNVTLTFADTAASQLPDDAPVSGTYKPTAYEWGDNFNPPGPGTTAANPGPGGNGTATLNGTFAGGIPNGVWKLFVKDFAPGDSGTIAGGWSLSLTTTVLDGAHLFDFDGDNKTDPAVVRSTSGTVTWFIRRSSDGTMQTAVFGNPATDFFTAGDYDGDGKADVSVWRPTAPSTFYALRSSNGSLFAAYWGLSGDDSAVVGDYDGDGRSDAAVWRPGATATAQSVFYILRSSTGTMLAQPWGIGEDFVAPGDFDGDGRFDFAVQRFQPGNAAVFLLLQSSAGSAAIPWGLATDIIVPGDYDGDGKTDIAVVRPQGGTLVWYIRRSSNGTMLALGWGSDSGDLLTPGDYDGDAKSDLAIWRRAEGRFYIRRSSDGGLMTVQWGVPNDYPVANAWVH
jgi:subtilisin-like proprotein convertase family protein